MGREAGAGRSGAFAVARRVIRGDPREWPQEISSDESKIFSDPGPFASQRKPDAGEKTMLGISH